MEEIELEIVPQDQWRAKQPLWKGPVRGKFKYVFFSVTDSPYCMLKNSCCKRLRSLQTRQQAQFKIPDIRYNFLIGGDGKVYEGRGWKVRPSLPRRYLELQGASLFIAFIGHFLDETPSKKMYDTRNNLVLYAVENQLLNEKFLQFNV